MAGLLDMMQGMFSPTTPIEPLPQNVQPLGSGLQQIMDNIAVPNPAPPAMPFAPSTSSTPAAPTTPVPNLGPGGGQPVDMGTGEGITPLYNHDKVPADVMGIVQETAATYNLPVNLLLGLIQQESSFNPKSLSSAGAAGYTQLMPDTAREMGVTNVWDARQNIMGGAKYLRKQLDTFGDVRLALAAYNAGPGAVNKYGRKIPPYRETQDYVRKVIGYAWGWWR